MHSVTMLGVRQNLTFSNGASEIRVVNDVCVGGVSGVCLAG
jgi:hypothetical protein